MIVAHGPIRGVCEKSLHKPKRETRETQDSKLHETNQIPFLHETPDSKLHETNQIQFLHETPESKLHEINQIPFSHEIPFPELLEMNCTSSVCGMYLSENKSSQEENACYHNNSMFSKAHYAVTGICGIPLSTDFETNYNQSLPFNQE